MSKQSGMTFIEIMMVLVIAVSIYMLAQTQYQSISRDNDARKIGATVDVLFQGLANYYRANCRAQYNPTTGAIIAGTGALDPANSPASNIQLAIANYLVANSYVTLWPPAANSLVDTTGGENGYIVQLNRQPSTVARAPGAIFNNWVPSTSVPYKISLNQATPPGPGNQPVGTMVIWTVQVAMKLVTGLDAPTYQTLLRANCVSSLVGSIVTPCSASPAAGGNYLVWERLPSYASSNAASKLQSSLPQLKQFKNLYTNDDMYGATNPTWGAANNNYLCGG